MRSRSLSTSAVSLSSVSIRALLQRFLLALQLLLALLLTPALVGCGGGGDSGVANASGDASGSTLDARLVEARDALAHGDVAVAEALAAKLSDRSLDTVLLRARIVFVLGDEAEALRLVEDARLDHPEDDRPFATAAELHAARGRALDAEEEIQRGWAVAGRTASLERARGVLLLSRPGGAAEGLLALESALTQDPELPYVALPLAQAHLLLGRRVLGEGHPDRGEQHARLALEFDPTGVEPRELLAECKAAQMQFREALKLYDALAEEGHELTAVRTDLHVKAATAALLRKERETAVLHYGAARRLGAGDEELGFGVHLLQTAADDLVDAGLARLGQDDPQGASREFERASELVPEHIEAASYLGHARFRAEDWTGAALCWSRVLVLAGDTTDLPEPIVVHLAKALRKSGEPDQAIRVLEDYVKQRPDDRWSVEAADLLNVLLHEASKE